MTVPLTKALTQCGVRSMDTRRYVKVAVAGARRVARSRHRTVLRSWQSRITHIVWLRLPVLPRLFDHHLERRLERGLDRIIRVRQVREP